PWRSLTDEYFNGIDDLASAFADMHHSGRLIIAALPVDDNKWQTWFIDESEIRQRIQPDKRLCFDLLDVPGLNIPGCRPKLFKLLPRHTAEESFFSTGLDLRSLKRELRGPKEPDKQGVFCAEELYRREEIIDSYFPRRDSALISYRKSP